MLAENSVCVCMCLFICICVCAYMYIYIYIYVCVCVCVCVIVCLSVGVYSQVPLRWTHLGPALTVRLREVSALEGDQVND